jgi:hypothetical protein
MLSAETNTQHTSVHRNPASSSLDETQLQLSQNCHGVSKAPKKMLAINNCILNEVYGFLTKQEAHSTCTH